MSIQAYAVHLLGDINRARGEEAVRTKNPRKPWPSGPQAKYLNIAVKISSLLGLSSSV